MSRLGWIRRRLDVLFRKRAVEEELDDELRHHLEKEIALHVAAGLPPEEALRRALLAFGGVERTKEQVRDARGGRTADDLVLDARVALRGFAKQPALVATILLTLGLGIGGNVAMFGILDAALFRPLPYAAPDRLAVGRVTYDGDRGNTVSAPDFYDVREQAESFASLAAFTPFSVEATVAGSGDPERVSAPYASWDLFATLGVEPSVGRSFLPEEGEPGGDAVVVLGWSYWQAHFGGSPDAVGGTLSLDGAPTTIVGVLPETFRLPVAADVWRPMVRGGAFAGVRQFHNWVLIGRLADEVDIRVAQAEVDQISERLAELYPDSNRGKGMYLVPLHEALTSAQRRPLGLLAAAVAALLLIACANVAGILLARASARRGEMALRSVLGAGRGRLVRQLMTENVLLTLGSAAVGLAIAGTLQRGILTFVAVEPTGAVDAGLSLPMAGGAAAAALLTVMLFGLAPALRGTSAFL